MPLKDSNIQCPLCVGKLSYIQHDIHNHCRALFAEVRIRTATAEIDILKPLYKKNSPPAPYIDMYLDTFLRDDHHPISVWLLASLYEEKGIGGDLGMALYILASNIPKEVLNAPLPADRCITHITPIRLPPSNRKSVCEQCIFLASSTSGDQFCKSILSDHAYIPNHNCDHGVPRTVPFFVPYVFRSAQFLVAINLAENQVVIQKDDVHPPVLIDPYTIFDEDNTFEYIRTENEITQRDIIRRETSVTEGGWRYFVNDTEISQYDMLAVIIVSVDQQIRDKFAEKPSPT